jgi:hypothetical protein
MTKEIDVNTNDYNRLHFTKCCKLYAKYLSSEWGCDWGPFFIVRMMELYDMMTLKCNELSKDELECLKKFASSIIDASECSSCWSFEKIDVGNGKLVPGYMDHAKSIKEVIFKIASKSGKIKSAQQMWIVFGSNELMKRFLNSAKKNECKEISQLLRQIFFVC